MTPPSPAPFTSDEYEPDTPLSRALSGLRAAWSHVQRALALVGALVIVAAVAGLVGYSVGRGKSRGELAVAVARIDSLQRARAAVDTVYRTDSITLTRWLTRWDTARVVDTLVRESIVYVRRDVADSTVAACLVTLDDCRRQRAIADSLVRMLREMPLPEPRAWWRGRVVVYGGHSLIRPEWDVGVGVALWRWP